MSKMDDNAAKTGTEDQAAVRLRRPQRMQVQMQVMCPDELVAANHQVRSVAAVVDRLDLSRFCQPIKAREGTAGRDATDPKLLVALWLYACICGIGSARELARRCADSRAFQWLCGGVTVNHRLLADFRVDHADALDQLFTQVVASLVEQDLVKVKRISQDGVRVRASAGAASFRREQRLDELLQAAKAHVAELRTQLEDPQESASAGAAKAAARKKAAEDRQKRLEQALAQLPELKEKQAEAVKRAGQGKVGQKLAEKQLRVSSTDPEARTMKMPNGGFNPAFNVQLATDTDSRAIVGVSVGNDGTDSAGLSEPMRQQVQDRTGKTVDQHLLDGGYMRIQDIDAAHDAAVELFMPPKTARNQSNRGKELEPKATDSPAILAWKSRMASEAGKEIYKQRAATSETVNADLRTHRGLGQFMVRGLDKTQCVALWCALAYNVMHFAAALMA